MKEHILPLKEILNDHYERGAAVMAFNIQNIYQLECLSKLCSESNYSAIAQFSAKYIPYFDSLFGLPELVIKYQRNGLFLHLDHCIEQEIIKYCIASGFASVMFDGSSLTIEENAKISDTLYSYASQNGTLLEIELGAIGGVEDGFGTDQKSFYSQKDLKYLVENTRFDLLALAIGNAHGVYENLSDIKIDKLKEARDLIGNTHFVLHGGTGMTDEMIRTGIKHGIVKINISTALKIKHLETMTNFCRENKSFDELKFIDYYMHTVTPFFQEFLDKFSTICI